MAIRRVQLRRGTTNDHTLNGGFTGAVGEITVDTTTMSVRVHDDAEAGGFDLMRADMSNNLAVVGNINFTDDDHTIGGAIDGNTLTLGQETTTVSIPGTLNVNIQNTTQDLVINEKSILLANGNATNDLSSDSIGLIFERTLDGVGGNAQDPSALFWDEDNNRFSLAIGDISTTSLDWKDEARYAHTDLALANLYATSGIDVNDQDIANVGQIALDEITFADAGAKVTITIEDGLDDKAFTLIGGATEYITVNTNAESTTLGVPSKEIILRGNLTTLGTDVAVAHTIEVETTTLVAGQNLTVKAGSSTLVGDTSGGDLILSTGAGDGTGTASIQLLSKVSGTDQPVEAMRIHTNGNVGIGEQAPDTLLHISGADTATLTLENTTGGNAQDDDPTSISFKGSGEALALAEITGAHDGVADDDKGVLIFKPNNDAGPTEALRLDSSLDATFANNVKINGTGASSLDFTDADVSIGNSVGNGSTISLGGSDSTVKTIGDLAVEGRDVVLGVDEVAGATTLKAETSTGGAGASLTISSGIGNNAGTNDGNLILASGAQTTLTISADQKATFAGAVEIATSLDMTAGAINNVTDIAVNSISDNDGNGFQVQAEDGTQNAFIVRQGVAGEQYINVDTDAQTLTLDQATNLTSTVEVSGLANLDGGVEIDNAGNGTNEFTVAHTSGNVLTKGSITAHGNTIIGVAGNGSPDLSVVNNAGSTTFSITGASGDTAIAGTSDTTGIATFRDSIAIQSQPVGDLGIQFNSDRNGANVNGDTYDVKVIEVGATGAGDGTDGVILWDDEEATFSVSSGKLNSLSEFTVGSIASPNLTATPTTGAVTMVGTDAYLTLKNTSGGNADGDSETRVIFQDDAGQSLAQIQGSHDGGVDDTKGDLIFSTNSGAGLSESLRLDSANLATFAGDVTAQDITASNGTINVGANGATIVATDANTLTITEDTIVATGNLQVNGNITGDANETKEIFTASVDEVSTITLGGGGTVITGGKLRLGSNIIENSASETTITLDANQRTTLSGDLAVVGGANDGLASTTILLGQDTDRDSKITLVARTGAHDGQDLTIEAGSSATDQVDQNGGDLILSSGGGDGTGTSNLILKTKISGSDAPTEKIRVIGSGFMGIGETSPDSILHLSHASAPTVTLQNLTGGNNEGDRANVLTFVGETGAGAEGELGNITVSHDTAVADQAGKIVFSTYATVDWQAGAVNAVSPVLTLDSTQQATFAGSVIIAGNLQVDGTTTTINTATLDVEDTVIRLNKGQAGAINTNDIGIYFERGDANNDGGVDNDPSAIFYWDEGDDIFKLGLTTSAHTATDFGANTTLGGLQLGSIVLKDDEEIALDIKRQDPDNTSMMKFVTTNGSEEIVFGSTLEIPTNSTIGTLTLADGSITDSNGSISFGDENLTTSGLASLDGGINVLDKFTVNNAGATVVLNTLTLNEATGNLSDLDVQSNGTSVFKVDVSANEAIINDGTLKTNKIQASADANDSFQMYLKDNTGLGFVISNVGDTVDFLTINTTTGSELITLVQDTSISETLTVVGDTTLEAEVGINTANNNGIFFNVDGAGNASADSVLMTIEGGTDKNDVVLAWDTTDNAINLNAESQIHLQGRNGSNALTIGGALVANATITMTTAGAITATSATSAFASGTTIGNVTYSDNVIAGATDATLTIKAETDLIFQIDSDNDGGDVQKFSFLGGDGTEIANLNEIGNLQIDGDLSVDGGDATITSGQDTDANLVLKSDAGDDAGDSWGITAVANGAQLTIGNDLAVQDTYAPILTLTGNAVATSTNATFAGEVTISGTGTNALDFSATDITIGNAIGANTLTLGATASTVAIPGDLTVATTKSITLNSGAAGADADIIVDRDGANNGVIRWVEGNGRFEVDNASGGTFYKLLTENDTLFNIDVDGDVNSIAVSQDPTHTITLQGSNDVKNQGLEFTITGDVVELGFENLVAMPSALNVDGNLSVGSQLYIDSNGGTVDIDVDSAPTTFAKSLGVNTLTIGGATSTVVSAGDLKVEGNLVYDSSTLTLTAGGEITVTKPYHKVELNNQGNATENLVSINATGVVVGTVLVLQAFHTDRSVVVKNTNFKLAGDADFTLDNTEDTISLIYNGTHWCELTRSNNNA